MGLRRARRRAATEIASMHKGRLEAFTDGVVAIIITIMVLEMKVPDGASFEALLERLPIFLAYVLSFINIGLFWGNHHHILQVVKHVDGKVIWANLFLLFWLSLVPFVIRWMDDTHFAALPTASYGAVLTMAAVGYLLLERWLIAANGPDSALARAVGGDRKAKISFGMYVMSMPLAFVSPWIAIALYLASALMWFVPDKRIEKVL
jgi:uncharacterized membrane protein